VKRKIVVDSCCDITPEMKNEMGVISVPLTMMLGSSEFCDDESLDMGGFLGALKCFTGKVSSAAPSPFLYQEAIEDSESEFVVTLSSKLSSSYNNAVIGNNEAAENGREGVHIFDSKSASAGETLIAIKIYELIKSGLEKSEIVGTVHKFIDSMKTYFVLENYDNLAKNGRLSKVAGSLIQMLNIRLIMGADGNGEIALHKKCSGTKHMLRQLLALIESSGKDTKDENLVISHCNNHSLAEQLKTLVTERFHFKKIFIIPTGGISSLYADDKGIVVAF